MSPTKPPPLHRPIDASNFPSLPPTAGSLRSRVHLAIKEMLDQGTLQAGDWLPGELLLAERWHINRQTVHRGLKDLEGNGFLAAAPGIGWYVPQAMGECDPDDQFEVYASPEDPQVLRVVVGEEFVWELDFRSLTHGAEVGEVPATWRRMAIVPG